jgi:hypothetical protein
MISIEAEHYPLIVCRWIGTITLSDFEAHSREMAPLFARAKAERSCVALVVDLTKEDDIDPAARRAMSAAKEEGAHFLGTWVTMTKVAKLMVTAMRWIGAKNLQTIVACSSVGEAVAGAGAALQKRGVKLAPATEAMLARGA